MTSSDEFTRASPQWIAAQRTNNATGEGISWTEGQSLAKPLFYILVGIIIFGGLCLIASVG